MKYCPECGVKIEGLVATPKFCPRCGFKFLISSEPLQNVKKTPYQIYTEKRAIKLQKEKIDLTPKQKKSLGIITIVIIISIIVILACALYLC